MRGAKAYTTSRNVPTHLAHNPQDISPKEAERAYRQHVIDHSVIDVPELEIHATKAYNDFGMTRYTVTVRMTDKEGVTVDKFQVPFIRLSKNKVKVFIKGDEDEQLRTG